MFFINWIKENTQLFTPYLFWLLLVITSAPLLMEQRGTSIDFPHLDKIIHVVLFGILTFIGYLAYTTKNQWICAGLICYGALTEVLQGTLTMTRHASFYDWLADIAGILICVIIIYSPHRKQQANAN